MKKLKRIAVQLARVCAASFALASCTIDPIAPEACSGGCDAAILFPMLPDSNGFYHVPLDWSREYLPYFSVDIRATQVLPEFRYNEESVVRANFDSDTSWIIGDTLVVSVPIFKPFSGDWTSTGLLPSGSVDVDLTQFEGVEVNIAQPTTLYFKKVGNALQSKRVLGPFIPQMIGDTITIAMKIQWDAGQYSVTKDNFSQKFIVE